MANRTIYSSIVSSKIIQKQILTNTLNINLDGDKLMLTMLCGNSGMKVTNIGLEIIANFVGEVTFLLFRSMKALSSQVSDENAFQACSNNGKSTARKISAIVR